MGSQYQFKPGDLVKVWGDEWVGKVVKVLGKKVTIYVNCMELTVPLNQVQLVPGNAQATAINLLSSTPSWRLMNVSKQEYTSFPTALDLHGMYVHEALDVLDKWLDKAFLLGHKHLRIIHGIGTGTLRKEIRRYLYKHQLVKKVIENHPFQGAGGVTLVELH